MELFLIRFLCGATLLLTAGLLGATLLRRRGPAAACAALRAALVGLVLCAIAAALPAPIRPIASIALPVAATVVQEKENTPVAPISSAASTAPRALRASEAAASNALDSVPPASPEPVPLFSKLPWQMIVLGVWAIGALLGMVRLLIGHFLLLRLRRSSQPLKLEGAYPVELRESALVTTPLLAGCSRPVLYLPQSGLLRESPEALQVALAHELAHHKRRDLAWSLLTQLLRAMLWFHPLIHLLSHQQELLAEQACDEAAVSQLPGRQSYARLLLTLSEVSPAAYAPFTVGMVSGRSRVARRIKHLLMAPLSKPLTVRGRAGIAAGTLILLVAGTALVGYAQEKQPAPLAQTQPRIRSFMRRIVTLSVKERPLQEVIAEVSRQSLHPITVDPSLTGSITVSIKNKTCELVLEQICPQIKPAAWFVRTSSEQDTRGSGFALIPLPDVGKFSGQVLNPEGKPVAGVRVGARALPDDSGKETPLALRNGDLTRTDAQGRFTLSRIGKWPYEVAFYPEYETGLIQARTQIVGEPGKTVQVTPVKLVRGAYLELQFPDYATYNRVRPETPAQYPDHRKKPARERAMVVLVPPGESRLVADKGIAHYSVRSSSGAGKWQLKDEVLSVHLSSGESARLVLDVELTAEEKQKRLEQQKKFDKESNLRQRQMATVKLPPAPMAFQEAVQKLCRQANVTEFVIEPGIGGTVTPRELGFFEHSLKDICAQATPVAYPLWEKGKLRIVRAPERGQFDENTRLYRLLGTPGEVVFQEEKGVFSSGVSGSMGVSHQDALAEQTVIVGVRDRTTEQPLAGVTIVHETHGNVRKVQTDAKGRCTLQFIEGRNYYYAIPPEGWIVCGSSSAGAGAETRAGFTLVQKSMEPDPRWKKWDTLVSFNVTRMPAREAIKQLFLLIGETDIVIPEKLTGTVTLNVQNKPFIKVFEQTTQQIKPFLIPHMRKKINLRPI